MLGAEISRMERAFLREEGEIGMDAGTWGKFLSIFSFVFIIFKIEVGVEQPCKINEVVFTMCIALVWRSGVRDEPG